MVSFKFDAFIGFNLKFQTTPGLTAIFMDEIETFSGVGEVLVIRRIDYFENLVHFEQNEEPNFNHKAFKER